MQGSSTPPANARKARSRTPAVAPTWKTPALPLMKRAPQRRGNGTKRSKSSRGLHIPCTVRKRHFLRHLYIKCIILPRQARDKHRENSKKVPFSLRMCTRRSSSCVSVPARCFSIEWTPIIAVAWSTKTACDGETAALAPARSSATSVENSLQDYAMLCRAQS